MLNRSKADKINLAILNLLQKNATMSYKEIATALGKPESTIRDRIKNLEKHGIIRGYVADIDRSRFGFQCNAFVMADVDPNKLEWTTSQLLTAKNVSHIYHISGSRRLSFLVVARDLDHLEKVIQGLVANLGLTDEEILVVLKTVRDYNIVPFE